MDCHGQSYMTKRLLNVSPDLDLTTDAVTQRIAIIGMSGAGKSNTAAVLVEQMLDVGAQVVILDPDGKWYGLRLSSDGKGRGIDIPVFGGLKGDIPLEPESGLLVADTLVNSGASVVLDVSRFSKNKLYKFATMFAERLFYRKQEDNAAMCLVIEEADMLIPQKVISGAVQMQQMQAAFEMLSTKGRKHGIGTVILTQRPQLVSKDALNQSELIFAHQTMGAQERKSLRDWIVEKGQDVNLLAELADLKIGEAFVWSPRWLKVMRRVQINLKRTYDAARTPKFGEKTVAPRALDSLDLEQLRAAMSETIERVNAEDPKVLRSQIAALKEQIRRAESKAQAAPTVVNAPPQIIEIPALDTDDRALLSSTIQAFRVQSEQIANLRASVANALQQNNDVTQDVLKLAERLERVILAPTPKPMQERAGNQLREPIGRNAKAHLVLATGNELQSGGGMTIRQKTESDLPAPLQRLLNALCALEIYTERRNGIWRGNVAVLSGYAPSTGTVNTYFSELKARGLIVYPQGERVATTELGWQSQTGTDVITSGQYGCG